MFVLSSPNNTVTPAGHGRPSDVPAPDDQRRHRGDALGPGGVAEVGDGSGWLARRERPVSRPGYTPTKQRVQSALGERWGFDVMSVGSYLGSLEDDPVVIPVLSRPLTG